MPAEFSEERDGEIVEFSKFTRKVRKRLDVIVVERFDFATCPICGGAAPDHEEHVPPQSLGGKVMTLTCQRCNNDFGTAEEEFRSLFDLEMVMNAEALDGSVPGRRRATVTLRSAPGRPNEFFVRSASPGFEEIRSSGRAVLTPKTLDMAMVAAAALKHSYIAVCLHNREIPETGEADLVRRILVAARDRNRDALAAGLNKLEFAIPMGWIEAPPGSPPVLLRKVERGGTIAWEFLLGGNIQLLWPLRSVQPLAARQDHRRRDGRSESSLSLDLSKRH